jgi:Flp pilus assembly protein TadB
MESHVKTVGILNIVYGVLHLAGGLVTALIFLAIGGAVGAAVSQQSKIQAQAQRAFQEEIEAERRAREAASEEGIEEEDVKEKATDVAEADRSSEPMSDKEAGMIVAGVMGVIFIVGAAAVLFWGIVHIVAGWAVMKYRSWARIAVILLAVLDLTNFPLGTGLGVYGLWTMLNGDTKPLFSGGASMDKS